MKDHEQNENYSHNLRCPSLLVSATCALLLCVRYHLWSAGVDLKYIEDIYDRHQGGAGHKKIINYR